MDIVYAFGSNGSGQLGIGHTEDTRIPTPCFNIPSDDRILKISGGGNHSALLTHSGHVFMSGFSQLGEEHMKTLTQQTSDDKIQPWLIYQPRFEDKTWRDVVCGWAFTLLIADDRKLYGVGTSRWNELLGPSTDKLVELMSDCAAVACGWRHVVALDSQGQVFGWGWGRHGQLGPAPEPPKDKKDIRPMHRIDMPQPIVQIACGHLHTLLLGKDGTLYGLGSNKYNQLGSGDNMIIKKNVTYIDAGWHHSLALDTEGKLSIWGRNDHGQLGKDLALDVMQVVCGSEHTVAIDKETGFPVSWGWNEHGNCTSEQDFVQEPIAITQFGKASVVGAGCAASWFISCKAS